MNYQKGFMLIALCYLTMHPLFAATGLPDKVTAWLQQRTPAGRWGQVKELGGTAVFLASEASDFINGQIIYVDGGMSCTV